MMNSCEGTARAQAAGTRADEAEAKTAGPLAGSLVKCTPSTQTLNKDVMLPEEMILNMFPIWKLR